VASGLSRSTAAVEQTLHGYNEGHGLIVGSADLDEESAALMLVMSDLAPRHATGPDGWLVGYPLPRAGRYVIARTWPAPEMQRPGCVWTHSLLLDHATIGAMGSLGTFLQLLRRPKGDFADYSIALPKPHREPSTPLPSKLFSAARSVLAELYGTNRPVLRELADSADAERLIMALWEQQWPRLRRRFRWATLDVQPSSEVPKFDLIATTARHRMAKPSVDRAISAGERQAWIVAALADLRAGGGDVRSELRRLAMDVQSGRRAFSLLISTMLLVKRPVLRPPDAQALINLMARRLRPDEAKLAKGAILAALLHDPSRLGRDSLAFALSLVPNLQEPEAVAIAQACWRVDQGAFWASLPQSDVGRVAIDRVLDEAPVNELVDALTIPGADVYLSITRRPDLLRQPALWRVDEGLRTSLVDLVGHNRSLLPDALGGLFAARDVHLAEMLVDGSSTTPMFAVYMDWERAHGRPDTQRAGFERAWLVAAASDSAATVDYLKGEFRLRPSVAALARVLGPKSFAPHEKSQDIWADAWENCAGQPVVNDRELMAAFFLYRSCNFASLARADHFAAAFGSLLDALEVGLRDPGARALVSDHFSQYGFFSLLERDVTKVCRGVAGLVANNNVPIAKFVANGRIRHVEALMDQLQWQPSADRVIRRAVVDLEGTSASKRRIKLLEQLLR
jgi:hypothetical protein